MVHLIFLLVMLIWQGLRWDGLWDGLHYLCVLMLFWCHPEPYTLQHVSIGNVIYKMTYVRIVVLIGVGFGRKSPDKYI